MKKKILGIIAIFAFAFFLGNGIAAAVSECISSTAEGKMNSLDWGLSFGNEGSTPVGNSSAEELKGYNAFYVGDESKKQIFLTFDVGYENGNTPKILDALKKHNVSATFFVVGNFIETNPELVKQMVEDGHTIGNHSFHHPDMSNLTKEEFTKELVDLEQN